MGTGKRLSVFYINADQALNKKEDLLVAISTDKPDIIILTEVILKHKLILYPCNNW